MTVQLGIKIEGMPKAIKYVNGKIDEAIKNANKGVKEATLFVESEVKQSIAGHRAEHTSVDTGRFLNSVQSSFPRQLQGEVSTNVDYAESLEYSPNIVAGPRKHFGNTKIRNEAKIVKFVQNEVNKI